MKPTGELKFKPEYVAPLNDPFLETLRLMKGMSETELEILKEYALKLKSAYAEKAKG